MPWGLLLVALLIAAAAYAVVALSRAGRTQRARSEERAAALLLELRAHSGSAAAQSAEARSASEPARDGQTRVRSGAAAGTVGDPAAGAVADLKALRRPRLLTDPQRLLYLLARSALPDHVVLANMRAIDLLDLPAGPEALARDARLTTLLHQRLDCVVCRDDLTPLAALVVYAEEPRAMETERELAAMLRNLGVRFLRLRSDSLPRPAEMRALVLT